MITAEPDIARITLAPEDEFLVLACDGKEGGGRVDEIDGWMHLINE